MENTKTKKCFNKCPNCGSDDIEGGFLEFCSDEPYQPCTCRDCGCHFNECYRYEKTEWKANQVSASLANAIILLKG